MDSATVSITIASDSSVEHDEHFLITLNDPVNGTVGDLYKTMVIIKDTDSIGKLLLYKFSSFPLKYKTDIKMVFSM